MAPWLAFLSLMFQGIPFPGGGLVHAQAAGYTGPGDVKTSAVMYWGLRCYNTAYTGSVADVWDSATGSTTHTLLTCSAGGTINETITALATTCAAGCVVAKLYDQSGTNSCNGTLPCDVGNNTNATRPTLTQNCVTSGRLCLHYTAASSQTLSTGGFSTVTATTAQAFTVSTVARQATAVAGGITAMNSIELYFSATPQIRVYAGTNQSTASVVNTWYAIQGIFNGASSIAYINGTSNPLASPGAAGAGGPVTIGKDPFAQFLNGDVAEVGLWATAFSGGDQSAMDSNQRTYWGF